MSIGKFAKGSIWYVGCSVVNMAITFGITPFITRMLSLEEYGFVSVYNTWHSILQIILTLNLYGGYYETLITRESENKLKITHRLMTITTGLTVIGSCILMLVWQRFFGFTGISEVYLSIMCLDILLYSFATCWYTFSKFEYRYLEYTVLYLSISFGKCILSIVLMLVMKDRQMARIIGLTLPDLAAAIYVIYRSFRLKVKEKSIARNYDVSVVQEWKSALRFNLPLIPHYLSNILLASCDRIMIDSISGKHYAGIYSLAYSYASLVSIVLYATNSAFSPIAYQYIKEKNYKKLSDSFVSILVIGLVVSVAAMLVAPEAIMILAPQGYYEGVYIVPLLIAGIVMTLFYNCYSYVEFYHKKNKTIAIATCVAAAINIITNFIFIPKFGYIAAAYTTILGYLVLSILHAITSFKILKINIIPLKSILAFCLALLVSVMVVVVSYNYLMLRIVIIISLFVLIVIFRKYICKICLQILRK